ncbi:hypothetical protein [Nonomuraea basaltis]|uniref:hypothetical protein n=1 Tax=Nonomuraea basaltis TaxID=2495887 RepID=UPI00110C45C0|nr:hypothetical protein [Nonomuraea basaltis]TMR95410.1 hypothetical protein EJK15_28935 [Nonomuraea basaltis]
MEGDHRVWPPLPGARHRRTPPEDTETAWDRAPARRDEEPVRGRRERASPREPHPLDLGPAETEDLDEPWNPRIRRTTEHPGRGRGSLGTGPDRGREWPPGGGDPEWPPGGDGPDWPPGGDGPDWPSGGGSDRSPGGGDPESLPPSARLYGTPVDPGLRRHVGGRLWRRWAVVPAALLAGTGLVAGATAVVLRVTAPQAETGRLSDSLAGVTATLPQGWRVEVVAPVTGFTSVIRDEDGGLVMARPVPGPVEDAKKATADAAELYSRLLLKGDRVSVVEDKQIPGGHTRALRAEYQDVVNRPAFLRVMLLTRGNGAVLLVGLLQPEEAAGRRALDAVMTSLR